MPRPVPLWPRHAPGFLVALTALALALTAGCSGSADPEPAPSPTPTVTTPTPTPTVSAAEALRALAGRGLAAGWTASYTLDPSDPSAATSRVTVFRMDAGYRIDIVEPAATTLFMTSEAGYVSCRLEGEQRTCLLVGPLDKPVPKVFDPGLQRIVTTNLTALAAPAPTPATPPAGTPAGTPASTPALTVSRTASLAEDGALPAAECFEVAGPGVDAGEYCLTSTGVPRRVTYPTGTLTMTEVAGAPNPQVLTPPVSPTPVPTTTS